MSRHDSSNTACAALYSVATSAAGGGHVADAALSQWRRVEAELSPFLGGAGVSPLYRRSLHQLLDAHPALAAVHEASRAVTDFAPLGHVLGKQSQADAASPTRGTSRSSVCQERTVMSTRSWPGLPVRGLRRQLTLAR